MSQVTIRAKSGTVSAVQLGLAFAILSAAEEVFAAKPELKATQVITDENEIVVVSKVKAGHTVEFTGREFKQANVARVSVPCQGTCSNPNQKVVEPEVQVAEPEVQVVEPEVQVVEPEVQVVDEQYED